MAKMILDNKKVSEILKNFEVTPYNEVEKRLDKAIQATIQFVAELKKSKEACEANG